MISCIDYSHTFKNREKRSIKNIGEKIIAVLEEQRTLTFRMEAESFIDSATNSLHSLCWNLS